MVCDVCAGECDIQTLSSLVLVAGYVCDGGGDGVHGCARRRHLLRGDDVYVGAYETGTRMPKSKPHQRIRLLQRHPLASQTEMDLAI